MQRLSRRAILGRRMTPTRLITSVSSTSENRSLQRARILLCRRNAQFQLIPELIRAEASLSRKETIRSSEFGEQASQHFDLRAVAR
jgi:hypothetical protein